MATKLHTELIEEARNAVTYVLDDLLPAGPDAKKPPPDWPHWQLAHTLMDAKLKLSSALGRLTEH
jgi:hypothetical protein